MQTKKLTALQLLTELAKQYQVEKYPTIPAQCLGVVKYNDKTTNGLTKCVMKYLTLKGYFVERTGNEGRVIDNRQTVSNCIGQARTIGSLQRIPSMGKRGTSDLKAIINGLFVAIEIKNKNTNDRQSEAQKQYQKQVETSGGIYIIVASFQGFYEWFNLFVKKGLA